MSKGFTRKHLTNELFSEILKKINFEATLISWKSEKIDKFGFVTDIVNKEKQDKGQERLIGLFTYELEYSLPNSSESFKKKIMLKSKPRSHEIQASFSKLVPHSEKRLLELFQKYVGQIQLFNSERIELETVRLEDEMMQSIMPKIYWSQMVPGQDIFVFAMEYLDPDSISHMFTVNDIHLWQEEDILTYLEGLAFFHAKFYNRTNEVPHILRNYIDFSYKDKVLDLVPFWEACTTRNFEAGVWTEKQKDLGFLVIRNLPAICDVLSVAPRTFIHGDLNLMNECLRTDVKEGMPKLCLYDWETCALAPPQHDAMAFLAMMFPAQQEINIWNHYMEKYYYFLKAKLESNGIKLQAFVDFQKVFDMCVCVEFITRYNWFFALVAAIIEVPHVPRLVSNLEKYVEHVKEKYNFV